MLEERSTPVVTDRSALTDPVPTGSSPTNLAQLVSRHARLVPDHLALVDPGDARPPATQSRRTLTWTDLDAQVDAVAGGLASHGLVAGHRVALQGPNSIEFVVAYFAVLRAGFVAVPIDPQADKTERQSVLLDSGARLLLTAGPGPDAAYRPDTLEILPLTADGLRALGDRRTGPVVSPQDAEALAVLLYTAGTSGESRAAMLPHRSLLAHLDHVAPLGVVGPTTVALGALPMFHVFGLNAVVGSWALGGGTLVVVDGYREDVFDIIAAERVTNLTLAPSMVYRMLHDDRLESGLDGVETIVSGAAPLPAELSARFTERSGHRVDQGYGLTEASPGVSATVGAELLGPGHVGRPLPGVAVRIGDGSDDSEPAEIFVRGENLFAGYWPDAQDGPGTLGWFGTGDIGYLRGDDLFLVDRARDLIEVSGFHVYPAEVEDAIRALDAVVSVAVIGRTAARGEQIVAFVVGAPGLTVEDVQVHCAARLARFKQPSEIQLVDELPRGATGKIQKGALRRLMSAPDVDPAAETGSRGGEA